MARERSATAPGGPVSVRKTTERQSDGVIVEYDLESTGEVPVTVRLSDRLRVETVEDLGFHEEHEPPEWTVEGRDLEVRASLDPGAERSFILGVVAEVGAEYDPAEPTLRVVDGGGFFDRAGRPLAEAAEEAAGSTDGGSAGDSTGDAGVEAARDEPSSAVVAALVEELEAGAVAESKLSTLRRHLGADGPTDEGGVAELHGRVDSVVEELEALRQRQETLRDRLEELAAELEAREADLESIRTAHEADVEAVRREARRRQEGLRDEVDDVRRSLRADLRALEAEVEALEGVRRRLLEGLARPGGTDGPAVDAGDEGSGSADPDTGGDDARDDGPPSVDLEDA